MGSFKQPGRVFGPMDLEVIDQVYKAVWAQVEALEPYRDRESDSERQDAIRKRIFAFAGCGPIDFDTLCDKVIATIPQSWTPTPKPRRSSAKATTRRTIVTG